MATPPIYVQPFSYTDLDLKIQTKISDIFQVWVQRNSVGRSTIYVERALKILTLLRFFLPQIQEIDYDKVDAIMSQYSNVIE